jgi:hypothetical protein
VGVEMIKKIRLLLLLPVTFALTACLGTVVGAVVDTTIEVVKIPFKVVGAAVDVVTGDELTDLSESDLKGTESIDSEAAAIKMENSEFK